MHPKSSSQPVYTVDEARAAVIDALSRSENTDRLSVLKAVGRVVAQDVYSRQEIPPFRNSAMDGYAIRHADFQNGKRFKVVGKSLAGHPFSGRLAVNCAVRITTGAMVPDDADTVVIQENTTQYNGEIEVDQSPELHQHIRYAGDDIKSGSLLVASGTCITSACAGLISAQGISEIETWQLPRIGVFSTGDELHEPGDVLQRGGIFDSNRTTIRALLNTAGFQSTDLGIQKDNEAGIRSLLNRLDDFDVIISSGGVSVGEADHMRSALEATGSLHFWKVAMKPGKPLVTGRLATGAFYFGLPGNPVSGMVTTLQFVIPALRSFCGHEYQKPPELRALCKSALKKEAGRFEFQRGQLVVDNNGQLTVTTTGMQDSHVLSSMAKANCFICLAANCTGVAENEEVSVLLFDTIPGLAGL